MSAFSVSKSLLMSIAEILSSGAVKHHPDSFGKTSVRGQTGKKPTISKLRAGKTKYHIRGSRRPCGAGPVRNFQSGSYGMSSSLHINAPGGEAKSTTELANRVR